MGSNDRTDFSYAGFIGIGYIEGDGARILSFYTLRRDVIWTARNARERSEFGLLAIFDAPRDGESFHVLVDSDA
jgi:hypothetical protein